MIAVLPKIRGRGFFSIFKPALFIQMLGVFALASAQAAPAPMTLAPKEAAHYTVYAQFLNATPVEMSNGAKWMMDKGDCFPVYMFKEQQTKVVLKLSSVTFLTEANKVRIMKASETGAALASYRKNVSEFLKTQSDNWKKDATEPKKAADQ